MGGRFGYGAQNSNDYNMQGQSSYGEVNSARVASSPYATTPEGIAYLVNNADSYVNALNQSALWNREDKLRKEAEHREDYSYDRLIEAAKRNGINPVLLLDSLSPQTGTAASYSTSAAKTSNYAENERTNQANSAKVVGALIAALAMILAAAA